MLRVTIAEWLRFKGVTLPWHLAEAA